MDNGIQTDDGLTVSFDGMTARYCHYLVSGTSDESAAIAAAESVTGLVASHADPEPFYDGFTVTLERF